MLSICFITSLSEELINESICLANSLLFCKIFFSSILNGVFNYSAVDKKAVEDTIEYLYLNGKIKKIKVVKHLFRFLKEWIKKKLL